MISIGCAINVFEDNFALPGLLENASSFFDDIFIIHAGPGNRRSRDGTIETIEKWGVKHVFEDMEQGFGVIRTKLIHGSSTEWVMILDADERFHPRCPVIHCDGSEKYPEMERPNLVTTIHDPVFDHGGLLKSVVNGTGFDGIRSCRRHWFDFTWKRPCENWQERKDWQCRILRNAPHIGFDPTIRMHERVLDYRLNHEPSMWKSEDTTRGIFHDHYHCHFKPMEPEQRKDDIKTYDMLHDGSSKEMWAAHIEKLK